MWYAAQDMLKERDLPRACSSLGNAYQALCIELIDVIKRGGEKERKKKKTKLRR